MNIDFETRCKVCHQKQEFLDHELIIIPFIRDGAYIGESQKQKICNVRFYCDNCKVNMSKPFPYNDEKVISAFIEDVKKSCVKFNQKEYREI
jgi:hypothetical protein